MKLKMRELTIRDRIYLVLVIFLICALASTITLKSLHSRNNSKLAQLNTLIRLDDELSAIRFNVNKVFTTSIFDLREKLAKQEKDFDKLIEPIKDEIQRFSTSKDLDERQRNFKKLNINWSNLKNDLIQIHNLNQKIDSTFTEEREIQINDSTSQTISIERSVQVNNPNLKLAIFKINETINGFADENRATIKLVIGSLNNSRKAFNFAFLGLVVLNILIFTLAYVWITRGIVKPLNQVGSQAKIIANGDINTKIVYQNEDEIGLIANAVNTLTSYLKSASKFVHQIGDGNLETDFEDESGQISEGGLTHALISMKDKLKKVAKEDERRNWATQGVAKFANIIRNNNTNLKQLSTVILSELVRYTQTNQGCIYLLRKDDNSNDYLELSAFYAFDSEKFFKSKMQLGEGLIGQTFLEKKTAYIEEIPDDYMKLKSGLSDIKPNSILLVPLLVNDDAYGILEMASFNSIPDYRIEFIEQLGEMIASAIANVHNNEQTQKLLSESQELTEMMKSQEEEMRQNMEELSATQEEMARKENQTRATIDAIDSGMISAEIDSTGQILTLNNNFTKSISSPSDKFEQLLFMDDKSNVSEEFWNDINNGIQQSGVFNLKNSDADYTPVLGFFSKSETGSILFFGQVLSEGFIQQKDDSSELQEELQQNLDSLKITEETLQSKINSIEQLDDKLILALLVDYKAAYLSKPFRDVFGNKEEINELIKNKLEKDLKRLENNNSETILNVEIDDNTITLKAVKMSSSGNIILMNTD